MMEPALKFINRKSRVFMTLLAILDIWLDDMCNGDVKMFFVTVDIFLI